jgi:hypothetical protein
MKLSIRILAFAVVAFAAVAGNSMPKTSVIAPSHQNTVPGPTPYCNPFTQVCPPIR